MTSPRGFKILVIDDLSWEIRWGMVAGVDSGTP